MVLDERPDIKMSRRCIICQQVDNRFFCDKITKPDMNGGFTLEDKSSKACDFFNKHHELIMYFVFGISTTAISWLVYSISEAVIGLNLYWSGTASWIVAVSFAFVTNKLWVFESKIWEMKLVLAEAITFFAGRALTGMLEVIAVPKMVDWGLDATLFGVKGLPAKIIVSVLIVALNYALSKFVSFNIMDIFCHKGKGKEQN